MRLFVKDEDKRQFAMLNAQCTIKNEIGYNNRRERPVCRSVYNIADRRTFMRILAIGDINGADAREFVYNNLGRIKGRYNIDFCVANGENTAEPNGITRDIADTLIRSGVDVITMGNHTFDNKESAIVLEDNERVIRPLNYPSRAEGNGFCVNDLGNIRVAVVNLIGRVGMSPADCPFQAIERLLPKLEAEIIIVDIHAEATSEKIAMANFLDGKVSVVFGTHTHVQTADERVLPNGTGYITDLGMTGVEDSVLGVKKEIIINHYLNPVKRSRFEKAEGKTTFCGCIFEVDEKTGKTTAVTRIRE